jgi:hypothetical protein
MLATTPCPATADAVAVPVQQRLLLGFQPQAQAGAGLHIFMTQCTCCTTTHQAQPMDHQVQPTGSMCASHQPAAATPPPRRMCANSPQPSKAVMQLQPADCCQARCCLASKHTTLLHPSAPAVVFYAAGGRSSESCVESSMLCGIMLGQ